MSDTKQVTIYTRGVSSPSGTGGYGAILLCAGRRKELAERVPESSNNRMDIMAAIAGLRALKAPCRVTLYSTNTYLTDAINKGWAQRWRANGWRNSEWRDTPHADLWQELLDLCAGHEVTFEYRRFDPDDCAYGRCDALAHLSALRDSTDSKDGLVPITAELIEAGRSERGGWSKRQLACLGVIWPPPSGWRAATVGRLIRQAEADTFLALQSDREKVAAGPGLFDDSGAGI